MGYCVWRASIADEEHEKGEGVSVLNGYGLHMLPNMVGPKKVGIKHVAI